MPLPSESTFRSSPTALGGACAALATVALLAPTATGLQQAWVRQLGTPEVDVIWGSAPDGAGGVLVVGNTQGDFGAPNPSLGSPDALCARYDRDGNRLWVRQIGTVGHDGLYAAAEDGNGGAFVGGTTNGSLGGPNAGTWDGWIGRYDGDGTLTWLAQLGTENSDYIDGAASDGMGGVYFGGFTSGSLGGPSAGTQDVFVARYDASGNQIWIRQFGTSNYDSGSKLAPDGSGGVFVGGWSLGDLGGPNAGGRDAWLMRYDAAGNQVWARGFGTELDDILYALAPDGAGGVYAAGTTQGDLGGPNAGLTDVWYARYDTEGHRAWVHQLGTSALDVVFAAAAGEAGDFYLTGWTFGDLGGPSSGDSDNWISRHTATGDLRWIHQFGTDSHEWLAAASPDGAGGAFAGGRTNGALAGPNPNGFTDAVLARYGDGPPPAVYCTAKPNSLGCTGSIGHVGSAISGNSSGFVVSATNVRNQKAGLLLYSLVGRSAAPFQGGILCLAPPVGRTPARDSGGNHYVHADCSGAWRIDMNAFASGLIGGQPDPALRTPGTFVQCQWWGRDPGDPHGSTLTDALQYQVSP